MTKHIRPGLQDMYKYSMDQTQTTVVITIKISENTHVNKFKVDLNADIDALTVTSSLEVPIIRGKLFSNVLKNSKAELKNNEYIITLEKLDKIEWMQLICDYYPGTEDIDPYSAYVLCKQLPSDDPKAVKLLDISADFGLLESLMDKVDLLEQGHEPEKIKLLERAAYYYGYNPAIFKLAMANNMHEQTRENALGLFLQEGTIEARVEAAKILSPASGVKYAGKDGARAISILECAIAEVPTAAAYLEAANLYREGAAGVERNPARAAEYVALARRLDPSVGAATNGSGTRALPWLFAGGAALAVGAIVFAAMRRRRH